MIPGLYDGRGKAFYMVALRTAALSRTAARGLATCLHPRALNGVFRYTVAGNQVREVNVLERRGAEGSDLGCRSDGSGLLERIQAAHGDTAGHETSDPLVNDYDWLSPGKLFEHQPTVKIDYNLTENHRLSGSFG